MITFRTATHEDCEKIAELVNSGYRGESSKKGWTTEADLLGGQRTDSKSIHDALLEKNSRIELATVDDELLACVHLKKESSATCYLGLLTVAPESQAGGIGKKLLEHAEITALKWGCTKMRMTVIQQRIELLAYYERRGYSRTGRDEPFPFNDEKFGVPKVEGLMLVELTKTLCVN